MCLATLATIGAVVGAAGTLESGLYQSQVAANNAKTSEQNAVYAAQAGEQQAAATSLKGAAQDAQIKAGIAANGVDVNTGSALDVQVGERETNKLNAEDVLNNADLQAYGYRTQAANDNAQSQQDVIGAVASSAGTLLGSASSIGGKWSAPSDDSSAGDVNALNWGG